MEHWSNRLREAMDEADFSAAKLSRLSGVPHDLVRKYRQGRVEQPRGDYVDRLAIALGVETLWLRDGLFPKRPGDMANAEPGERADEIIHRREMAKRIAGARQRRGIVTPEEAALGTYIRGDRWRKIESGQVAPTPLELQVISGRLWTSLDWIVSGHVTPVDDHDPVEAERARRSLQERPRGKPPPVGT